MSTKSTRANPTREITTHKAAVGFTLLFPVLSIMEAVFFVLLNSGHPEYMSVRSVMTWALCFAGLAVLTIASAVTAFRTFDRQIVDR